MNDKQSLANQLGWSISTKEILNNLCDEIEYVKIQYENMISMLSQGGYFEEMLSEIEKMYNDFEEQTVNLEKHINDVHLSYIQKQIDILIRTMSLFPE